MNIHEEFFISIILDKYFFCHISIYISRKMWRFRQPRRSQPVDTSTEAFYSKRALFNEGLISPPPFPVFPEGKWPSHATRGNGPRLTMILYNKMPAILTAPSGSPLYVFFFFSSQSEITCYDVLNRFRSSLPTSTGMGGREGKWVSVFSFSSASKSPESLSKLLRPLRERNVKTRDWCRLLMALLSLTWRDEPWICGNLMSLHCDSFRDREGAPDGITYVAEGVYEQLVKFRQNTCKVR